MTEHPVPRGVSFTGSIATGKKVNVAAAADLKRVTARAGRQRRGHRARRRRPGRRRREAVLAGLPQLGSDLHGGQAGLRPRGDSSRSSRRWPPRPARSRSATASTRAPNSARSTTSTSGPTRASTASGRSRTSRPGTAYAADGLEVIGVHTPEYAFEHVPSNVAAGAQRLGITYPVALDNATRPGTTTATSPGRRTTSSTPPAGPVTLRRRRRLPADRGAADPAAARSPPTRGRRCRRRPRAGPHADRRPVAGDLPRLGARAVLRRTTTALRPARTRTVTRLNVAPNYFALSGTWTVTGSRSPRAGRRDRAELPRRDVYLDVGGSGTLTVSVDGAAGRRSSRSPAPRTSTPSPRSTPPRTAP